MNVQPNVNQPRTPATDSRALQNLLKSEKAYGDSLLTTTSASLSAASSLAAWGISETPDLDRAAQDVASWLEQSARGQRMMVQAVEGYRAALKDILDREHSIGNIVRDRDILLNRVLKESVRRPTRRELTAFEDEHQARFMEAQRELAACEQVLGHESAALIGVKRRTFKEALTMRSKCMGEAGAVMMDAAREIITRLDNFDANVPVPRVDARAVAPVSAEQEAQLSQIANDSDDELVAPSASAASTDMRKPHPPPAPAPAPAPAPVRAPSQRHSRSTSDTVPNFAGIGAGVLFRSPSAQGSRHAPSTTGRYTPVQPTHAPAVPGGVPTAPRLDVDALSGDFVPPPVAGPIPSAPGTVLRRNAPTESSFDSAPRRDGGGWNMRPHRIAPTEDGLSSIDPRAHQRQQHHAKGSSFFSKVSQLFRSDMRTTVATSTGSPVRDTRRHNRGMSFDNYGRTRDDSSDDEPVNVVRHVNERPGSAMRAREMPDDAITEAARRSVIGAGISSPPSRAKQPSRPGSRQSLQQRPASRQSARPPSRQSLQQRPGSRQSARPPSRATSLDLPPPSLGPIPRGYSSQNVAAANAAPTNLPDVPSAPPLDRMVGEVQQPVRRKKGAAGPPPAPSSFYQGFAINPAKYATDTWVAKSDAMAPADEVPRRRKVASSPSKKGKRVSADSSLSKHDGSLSLSLDTRLDGTGHIDLDLRDYNEPRAAPSPVKPAKQAPVAKKPDAPAPFISQEVDSQPLLSADEEETYRAFLAHPNAISRMSSGSVLAPASPHRGTDAPPAQDTAPAVQNKVTSPAPARKSSMAPMSASSNRTRKNVRINSDTETAPEPKSAADELEDAPGGRMRRTWSTRIGTRSGDSSDEDDTAGGGDVDSHDYLSARKAFGSATRHLGVATGTMAQKPKKAAGKRSSYTGYNPSVHLPAGLETVARSH